jgi:hypothetical protein
VYAKRSAAAAGAGVVIEGRERCVDAAAPKAHARHHVTSGVEEG